MKRTYDLIIIGSGPGGYVAAIRAAQLGMQVAIVEQEALGGICLNWGCIPTKALLHSAQVFEYIQKAASYGIQVQSVAVNLKDMVGRSRKIAKEMNQGIDYLLKKNNITVLYGRGMLYNAQAVVVLDCKNIETIYQAEHIIIATGARSRMMPQLSIDSKRVIDYREAVLLEKQPKSIIIVGAGAIGVEFAYFYNAIGTEVTLIEYQPHILSLEDEEVSKHVLQTFVQEGIKTYTASEVIQVTSMNNNQCQVQLRTPQGTHSIISDIVFSAVGITANIENLGLEAQNIVVKNGKISVDSFYGTNISGIYAIGDVIQGPALAHVASAEGIICVEKLAGLEPEILDYHNIPNCIYCQPEIASIGYTEKSAHEAGYKIKVGKFPFSASGKAHAVGMKEGFVKVIFDAQYGEWLGAHMVGTHVTEMIAEVAIARKLETTAHEVLRTVHPHPTMSEAIVEAVANAYEEGIHL